MGNPVVHFEIDGRNAKAMQRFYAGAFGWDIHADNPMSYGTVHTNAEERGIGHADRRDPRDGDVRRVRGPPGQRHRRCEGRGIVG